MPRFTSPNGDVTIETASPREAVRLRSQGFKEQVARTQAVKVADAQVAATPKPPEKK